MYLCKVVLTIAIVGLASEFVSTATDKVVCYYGSWANYRNGNGKFVAEDINPFLCTHLIYTFLGVETNGNIKVLDDWLEFGLKNIARVNSLKQQNPNLKTMIAVGGWNEGSIKYSAIAADATKRATFIQSARDFVIKNGFDGFDLDWEYPGQRGGSPADKENYVTLLREMREEWDKHGLLLSAAVAAAASSVDQSYNVPALSKYLDFINVMAYDLHGAWDGVTGANAPLYPSAVDLSASQKSLTVDASIRGWIQRGADPQKLVMGMGVYGRSFTLANANNPALGAPVTSGGTQGPYTSESGMLGYNEICELQLKGGWTVKWDPNTRTPYAYKGNQWVGYDNPSSIAIKVKYAISQNLGGVMIWSIETEDSKGICGKKYPILNVVSSILNTRGDQSTSAVKQSTVARLTTEVRRVTTEEDKIFTTSRGKTTVPDKDITVIFTGSTEPKPALTPNDLCTKQELIRDPDDCAVFYYCIPHLDKFVALKETCQKGLYFDVKQKVCNYANLVEC